MPNPVVFAVPADVELDPAPIPPDWVIEGNPQACSKRLATSADGTSTVMAWSCTAGRFKWYYTVDETIHLISGEVFVTDENDNVRRVGPGDMVFFPAGAVSTWHIPDHVRKLAVCRHSMPRLAGFALRAFNKLVGIVTGSDSSAALESAPQSAAEARHAEAKTA
ncbi:MAG TPA: cupin domain-containing protein [Xanthobacteraceae bacterium]|nr:cupin domain-containing protein [Xanthobacteraceae bacterium]